MSGTRFLALVLVASALVAMGLMAIPIDGAGTGHTASIPDASASYRLTAGASTPAPRPPPASSVEQEAAMPRLWLGSPVVR
jgi:hypothetical protein